MKLSPELSSSLLFWKQGITCDYVEQNKVKVDGGDTWELGRGEPIDRIVLGGVWEGIIVLSEDDVNSWTPYYREGFVSCCIGPASIIPSNQ